MRRPKESRRGRRWGATDVLVQHRPPIRSRASNTTCTSPRHKQRRQPLQLTAALTAEPRAAAASHTTSCPRVVSCRAAAIPLIPAPITITRLRYLGSEERVQPHNGQAVTSKADW